jgi:hypothetical protein
MTTALGGQEITLVAIFELDGTAADPELPLRLTVAPLAGGAFVVDTSAVTRVSQGTFTYAWTPPEVQEVTDFLAVWDPSGDDVSATEVVQVLPAVEHTWATMAQVVGFTGKEVSAASLQVASGMITLYGNADPGLVDSYRQKDLYWLAMATSYQAVWVAPKLDTILEDRESHTSTSADGVQVTREAGSDLTLAPLAARALRNLSWIGGGINMPLVGTARANFLNEADDHVNVWMSGRGR